MGRHLRRVDSWVLQSDELSGDRVGSTGLRSVHTSCRGAAGPRRQRGAGNIESEVQCTPAPFFRGRALDAVRPEDVHDLVGVLETKGLSPKSIRNVIGHAVCAVHVRAGAAAPLGDDEPVNRDGIDSAGRPGRDGRDPVPHARGGRRALSRAPPAPGMFEAIDRAMRLHSSHDRAAQGRTRSPEMARRVDWTAKRIRVRQNYVRGEFGTPKSKRSTRSVPMADEVAGELDLLPEQSCRRGRRRPGRRAPAPPGGPP